MLPMETLEDRRMLDGMPLITEFLAANTMSWMSQSCGQYFDWIEIYNPGPGAVDLNGWYLTDDKNELHDWLFPASCVLAEGEFLVVFASGQNVLTPEGEWHTSFRLSLDGEYLALVRPDGTSVISQYEPESPPQTRDVSYGWTAGLDDEAFFQNPTPGEMNPADFPYDFDRDARVTATDMSLPATT